MPIVLISATVKSPYSINSFGHNKCGGVISLPRL
jgi:hypothetical protein